MSAHRLQHILFLPFTFTFTLWHRRIALLPFLILTSCILASCIVILLIAINLPKAQSFVAIPTLAVVALGCAFALWPFVERIGGEKLPAVKASVALAQEGSARVIYEISSPIERRGDVVIELMPVPGGSWRV